MRSSNVAFASSIIAHSSPRISTPWPASSSGSTRRGSLPSSSRPSESASRRAGSIVTTATRWPAAARPERERRRGGRLADAAGAGDDHDALAVELLREAAAAHASWGASSSASRSRSGPPGCSARRAGVDVAGELAQPRELRALAQRARVDAQRAGDGRVRGVRLRGGGASAAVKRSGSRALAMTRASGRPIASRSASRSRPVSVTASSSRLRDGDDRRALWIGQQLVDDRALARDGPAAGRCGERPRRAEDRDAVAGRGRVDDDEVVGVGAGGAAVELGELPELADRQQLAHAGRGGGDHPEDAAADEDLGDRRRRELVAQVLVQRVLRVDGDVEQPGRDLRLRERLGARAVEGRRDVAAARDLGDDRALARTRGDEPEGGRDRRLADAALARHDDQPPVEEDRYGSPSQ